LEQEIEGKRCEPFELVDVELPEEYSGSVIDMLGQRKGNMLEMGPVTPEGIISMQYEVRVSRGAAGGGAVMEWVLAFPSLRSPSAGMSAPMSLHSQPLLRPPPPLL
jgi:hypothetical protein